MDKLPEEERFATYTEKKDLVEYLRKFRTWLENDVYAEIVKRVNWNLGLSGSATWDPGSIANGAEEVKEVTVTDAGLGDFAIASFSLDVSDLQLTADVTAADTVTCVLSNSTGGAVNLGSGTLRVKVIKK